MALATGSAVGPVAGAGTLIAPGKMVLPRFGASTTTVPASRCGLGRNDLEADLIRNGRSALLPLSDGFRVDPVALRQRPQARVTMLYRSTDCLCRRGAPMKNLAHSASFESFDKDAPSKPGTKHLVKDLCGIESSSRGAPQARRGDPAPPPRPSSLDRFAYARDDDHGSWRADADHPEGQKLALLFAHRHVLADLEGVVTEAKAFLLRFVLTSPLPLEGPGRAATAAGVIDEEAAQRGLIAPEAMGETFAPMLLPGFEIDVAIGGQRRDEIIAVPDRAFREFLRARYVQRHLSQRGVSGRGH